MNIFSRVILTIFLFQVFSCNVENRHKNCIQLSEDLSKENFIDITDRGNISEIVLNNREKIVLPYTEKYNYMINDNFINNDTIYLKRINKNTTDNRCNIIKIKKDSIFSIYSTLNFKSSYDKFRLVKIIFSNNKKKIALLYHLPKDRSLIRIVDKNLEKVLFEQMFPYQVNIYQQAWSEDDNQMVFTNSVKEIFVLNMEKDEIKNTYCKGVHPIWLQSLDFIAYLTEKNAINLFDLKRGQNIKLIKFRNDIFSYNQIDDYYWFDGQSKLYLKTRVKSRIMGNKLWERKKIVYKLCI